MVMERVNLSEKLAQLADHWSPKVIGELNGQHVKLVKFVGEFVWHRPRPRGRTVPGREGAVHDGVPEPPRGSR